MNNAIEISDLRFSFNGIHKILSISELNIKQGERVFIHGPSGCGKSTLLNLMAGITAPQTGTLKVLGEDLVNFSQSKRDSFRGDHIGYIFQNFNLISYLNTYENLILPFKASKRKAILLNQSLKQEIEEIAIELNIQEQLYHDVSRLSVGQQQRVAVARALLGSPDLIIADEPTSSLDDENTESFIKLLTSKHDERKFTLILVSHDKRLEKHFDRTISLLELNQVSKYHA